MAPVKAAASSARTALRPHWAASPPTSPTPPAQPAPLQPPAQSGMLKAAVILLLVGAILWAAMAALMLGVALVFGVLFATLGAEEPSLVGGVVVAAIYGVWGLLGAAGAICGFVGWRKASRGDLDGGFLWGLVGSLLPPLNIVSLLGAIFVKVCPEHDAQERARRQAWGPPR